eukprot:jgi/Mesvir1/1607/Mv14570-RA.1
MSKVAKRQQFHWAPVSKWRKIAIILVFVCLVIVGYSGLVITIGRSAARAPSTSIADAFQVRNSGHAPTGAQYDHATAFRYPHWVGDPHQETLKKAGKAGVPSSRQVAAAASTAWGPRGTLTDRDLLLARLLAEKVKPDARVSKDTLSLESGHVTSIGSVKPQPGAPERAGGAHQDNGLEREGQPLQAGTAGQQTAPTVADARPRGGHSVGSVANGARPDWARVDGDQVDIEYWHRTSLPLPAVTRTNPTETSSSDGAPVPTPDLTTTTAAPSLTAPSTRDQFTLPPLDARLLDDPSSLAHGLAQGLSVAADDHRAGTSVSEGQRSLQPAAESDSALGGTASEAVGGAWDQGQGTAGGGVNMGGRTGGGGGSGHGASAGGAIERDDALLATAPDCPPDVWEWLLLSEAYIPNLVAKLRHVCPPWPQASSADQAASPLLVPPQCAKGQLPYEPVRPPGSSSKNNHNNDDNNNSKNDNNSKNSKNSNTRNSSKDNMSNSIVSNNIKNNNNVGTPVGRASRSSRGAAAGANARAAPGGTSSSSSTKPGPGASPSGVSRAGVSRPRGPKPEVSKPHATAQKALAPLAGKAASAGRQERGRRGLLAVGDEELDGDSEIEEQGEDGTQVVPRDEDVVVDDDDDEGDGEDGEDGQDGKPGRGDGEREYPLPPWPEYKRWWESNSTGRVTVQVQQVLKPGRGCGRGWRRRQRRHGYVPPSEINLFDVPCGAETGRGDPHAASSSSNPVSTGILGSSSIFSRLTGSQGVSGTRGKAPGGATLADRIVRLLRRTQFSCSTAKKESACGLEGERAGLRLGRKGVLGRCALVGLSRTLSSKRYGSAIDGHDTIIRMGFAPLEGYKEHVGAKTDIVFLRQLSAEAAAALQAPRTSRRKDVVVVMSMKPGQPAQHFNAWVPPPPPSAASSPPAPKAPALREPGTDVWGTTGKRIIPSLMYINAYGDKLVGKVAVKVKSKAGQPGGPDGGNHAGLKTTPGAVPGAPVMRMVPFARIDALSNSTTARDIYRMLEPYVVRRGHAREQEGFTLKPTNGLLLVTTLLLSNLCTGLDLYGFSEDGMGHYFRGSAGSVHRSADSGMAPFHVAGLEYYVYRLLQANGMICLYE